MRDLLVAIAASACLVALRYYYEPAGDCVAYVLAGYGIATICSLRPSAEGEKS